MTRILIIDDVYSVRLKMELVLRNTGPYTTYSAGSGLEAIQMARTVPPDIIITDIVMAEMDGIATLQELRAQGITCPVIAYTARAEKTPDEFLQHGFSAYVAKSNNLSHLLAVLRAVLKTHQRPVSSASTFSRQATRPAGAPLASFALAALQQRQYENFVSQD